MGRRRGWLAWMFAISVLAVAIHWLLGPADRTPVNSAVPTTSETGGPPGLAPHGRDDRRSRLDELVAWIRGQFDAQPDPGPAPTPFEPTPSLGPPGTLEVVVRQEGGSGIAGARVVVFGPPGGPVLPARTTDTEGRAAFAGLPSGPRYDVHANIPGPDPRGEDLDGRRIAVRAGEATVIVLERPSLRVEGDVRDAITREPVAGAEVEAFDVGDALAVRDRDARDVWTSREFGGTAPAPRVGSALTEPDGRFRLDAGARSCVELRVRASDGRAGTKLVSRSSARWPTHLLVRTERPCEGIVVDAAGRPQPGLRLSAPAGTVRAEAAPSTTTDTEGRFSLPVSAAGPSARLVVEGDGVPRFSVRVLADRNTRIVVPGSAALDVRVVEDGTDRPLAGAHLMACVGPTTTEATTDADGRARVAAAGGPISILRVFAAGFREVTLESDGVGSDAAEPADALLIPLGARETRLVTVRARRGAVVVGRVLHPNGGPAEHMTVWLTTGWGGPTPTARSGPDGRFAVTGCVAPPPAWTIGVRAYGDGGAEGAFEARVPTDGAALSRGTIDLGDVTLRRGAVVRAQVVDPDGRPIPEASASGNVAALAGPDGWLAMAIPAGTCTPSASIAFDVAAPGFRTRAMRCSAALGPGEVRDLPPIRLERGARVAVRVLDADGHPVADCEVRWEWNGDRTPVRTDSEGRATLSGAPSEEESVQVGLPDGAHFMRHGALPPVAGDRIDLDLRLPRTRTLVVRVLDAADSPVPLASVSTSRQASPPGVLAAEERWASADATGLARMTSVVATPVLLRVHAPGFVTAEFTAEGAATSAAVTLEAIGVASGRRLGEVLASLERLEREIHAQDPDDDSEDARARFRRQRELRAECDRLRGR